MRRPLLVAATTLAVAACAPRNGTVDGAPATAADTARGVVALVGSDPMATLVLQPAAGPVLALEGTAAAPLRTLGGVEVMVAGARTGARAVAVPPAGAELFRVDRFVVRAVDGAEASDGVLVEQGGAWSLRLTTGGERRLASVPAALQAHRGARVYVAGADAGRFGLISP